MPRPHRPIADGSIYHVINRGNNRQPVFLSEGDYLAFLRAIADLTERKPFALYASVGNCKSTCPCDHAAGRERARLPKKKSSGNVYPEVSCRR